jgi:hypothetical protein
MRWLTATLVATLTLLAGPAIADTPRVPVILDTDIGSDVDDAFALALAVASPELELVAVTTVGEAQRPGGWCAGS